MTQQEFFSRYTYKPSTDKLGGGAFGTVFKAYDETLGKYIAIKVAEQKHIGDRILSLADEFNALKNIQDHKNIAKYDVFYTFEQPTGVYDFALMQYYPDGNLSQLIKKGNLTTAQKENLALQLLNGISFLHQNNVVHRDLKPSNILIQKHELTQEYIPKITDFGLSKKANTDKGTQFTNSFAAGTYAYSSPEQLKGEILRFNTDLWAYGAIVYEIFTGKTMFNIQQKTGSSALDIKDILDNILNNDITQKIAELPTKWQQIVTACLERNAQKRVKTADEILEILNSNKTNSEDETIIEPQEKTKPAESTIDKTQFETTRRVTSSTAVPSSMERIGVRKTALYIGIAILAIGILTFAFWPKANNTNQTQTSIATSDSLPKTDTTTIATPAITETDWEKDFDTKFTALQATEKQNTTEVNIKNYKELLTSLPSEAKNEKQKLVNIIESLSKNKPTSTVNEKVDPNWSKKYDYFGGFSEGLGYVTLKGKKGFVDKNGRIVIPPKYDDMGFFTEGLAPVGINGKHGYINKKGNIVVPLIYDYTYQFKEGLGGVMLNSKSGFIDKNGNVIIPIIYSYFYQGFNNGVVLVKLEDTSPAFFINKKGECVKDCP